MIKHNIVVISHDMPSQTVIDDRVLRIQLGYNLCFGMSTATGSASFQRQCFPSPDVHYMGRRARSSPL